MSDFPDRVPLDWALIEQVQRKPFLGTLCHEYTRSDLVQRQIAEAVQKERERCLKVVRNLGNGYSWSTALDAIRNGEEA